MRNYGFIALIVAGLDQIIKACVRKMPVGETFFEISGLLSLTQCVNTGAAFSMLSGYTRLLTGVSAVLLALILVYVIKSVKLTAYARAALACLVGGGIGNWLDRLLFSGVTDYIHLRFIEFPVFNLADIAITCSVGVMMVLLITNRWEYSSEDKHGSDT